MFLFKSESRKSKIHKAKILTIHHAVEGTRNTLIDNSLSFMTKTDVRNCYVLRQQLIKVY